MATDSRAVLEDIFRQNRGNDLTQKQRTQLFNAMSPRCLIASFYETFRSDSGEECCFFRLEELQEIFLLLVGNDGLLEQVAKVILEHFERQLRDTPIWTDSGAELLPVLPILLECSAFDKPDTDFGRPIIDLVALNLLMTKKEVETTFAKLEIWWEKYPELLERAVKIFLQAFKWRNRTNGYTNTNGSYLSVLTLLSESNRSMGFKIDVDKFYLGQVEDAEHTGKLGEHLLEINSRNIANPATRKQPSLLGYPFLLDVATKWKITSYNFSHFQATQQILYAQVMARNMALGMIPMMVPPPVKEIRHRFEIDNDKEKTVESALSNISGKADESLLLPLEIHFKSDISLGVNAGGPMKEFFSRFLDELFNVEKHSIFRKLDDSSLWFNKDYKDVEKLRKIGKLFALMVYNKNIITLPFPILFYKKLLTKSESSFDDLKLLDPAMASSMEVLLTMNDDDLSTFTFTIDGPDDSEIELRPGGKDEVVNTGNVREYLELYAKHYTATSQFEVFSESFQNMFGRFGLEQLFTPQELMSLFLGGEYDWKAFQKSFGYENGYSADHRVIKMFWSVFHKDLDESKKRDFLRFLTGANHVPLGGFQEIGARVWPMGDEKECRGKPPRKICPEVNTCIGYVVLHLPMYSEREHLKDRLLKLLEMKGQGFHRPVEPV